MNYGKKGVQRRQRYINPIMGKLGKKCFVTSLQLLLVGILVVIVAVSCAAIGMFRGIIETTELIDPSDVSPTGYKTVVYDSAGTPVEELIGSEANRVYVTIDKIPLDLQHAFIAIEDARFYTHNGIDPKGILRALTVALKNKSLDQGASTITQQLIKNNVFNAFNESTSEKIKRKIREQYLALKLEEQMTKDEILENYLNTINLGNGNFGVQAAAQNYFNKDVGELTISECAVIAGITKFPESYNPVKFPETNKERQRDVLLKMYEQKYITKAQYDEALADDVYARIQNIHSVPEETTIYSYFTDELIKQVRNDLITQKGYTEDEANRLIYKGGLKIYSTQDSAIQQIVDEEFANPENFPESTKVSLEYTLIVDELNGNSYTYSANSLQYYFINKTGNQSYSIIFKDKETADQHIEEFKTAMLADGGTVAYEKVTYVMQPQASMTIMDQATGKVLALIGGRGEKIGNLTFNRATESTRQPGSTFKPLTAYGPAIDMGKLTLASVLDDTPYHYKDGTLVINYDKRYLGLNDVRFAIADSRNVPAVKALSLITPQIGFNYALKFGFTTLIAPENMINGNHDMVDSLCLGGLTYGVKNIELCAAYAAIANKGVYNEPIYYTAVYDRDGNLILDNSDQVTQRVIKESTSDILTSALESVTAIGTGKHTNVKTQPVAGKTGTTNNDVDKWYVGYTPYYTGAIWFGYDDTTRYDGGAVLHVKLWGKVMSRVHEGMERGEFTMSNNIIQKEVCSQSGKLVVEGLCDHDPRGSQVKTEYFIRGTEPTEPCDVHVKVTYCADTNQLATSGCTNIIEQIHIQKSDSTFTQNFEDKYPTDSKYTVSDAQYEIPEELVSCITHAPVVGGDTPGNDDTPGNGNNIGFDDIFGGDDGPTEPTTKPEETKPTKPAEDEKPTTPTKPTTPETPEDTQNKPNDEDEDSPQPD